MGRRQLDRKVKVLKEISVCVCVGVCVGNHAPPLKTNHVVWMMGGVNTRKRKPIKAARVYNNNIVEEKKTLAVQVICILKCKCFLFVCLKENSSDDWAAAAATGVGVVFGRSVCGEESGGIAHMRLMKNLKYIRARDTFSS